MYEGYTRRLGKNAANSPAAWLARTLSDAAERVLPQWLPGASVGQTMISRVADLAGGGHLTPALDPAIVARLKRDANGLVAAIAQQYDTGEVLMLGWVNDEALRRSLASGRATYWSRSRGEYWRKGDTSGNVQYLKSVKLDCDGDALLYEVEQVGSACHTGTRTCFTTDVVLESPDAERQVGAHSRSVPA